MANKKFSEFDLKTNSSDVAFVVGFNGSDNVRIAPSNLTGGGGASSLNGLSDVLIDTASEYVGTIPSGLSGNPQGNTTLGISAGLDLTSGPRNTLIGNLAGQNINTGEDNVIVGYEAANNLTNGTDNVCMGKAAFRNGNGFYNTAIGDDALRGSGSKNFNTAIGRLAGSAITTGGNNTLLGNSAAASSATVSNEITLGNSSITALRCAVTSITSLSDERDKSEIKDLDYGLDFVDSLKPREFVWNNRPEFTKEFDEDGNETEVEFYSSNKGKKDFGFIAQEVQALDDDTLRLVYDENPEKLELSYGKLVPILVKAIQDLSAKVTALENA